MLELRSLSKAFPGVQALSQVSLQLAAGEIHALVGENGAGKSTLMNILSGLEQPDGGEIRLDDRKVHFRNSRDALRHGLVLVPQEIQVIPESTIAENIMLDRLVTWGPTGFINWKALNGRARELAEKVGLGLPVTARAGGLGSAHLQLVQMARALGAEARFLLLDEPTSSLSEHEAGALRGLLQGLKNRKVGILFVSHNLEEVLSLCDRVSVLRDGRLVGTYPTSSLSRDRVVKLMIGREAGVHRLPEPARIPGREMLRVEGLTSGKNVRDVSFSLRAGEILGLYGLVGSGRSETARLIIGANRAERGRLYVRGHLVRIHSVAEALHRYGIGYVSENRKEEGLFLEFSVVTNLTLTIWQRLRRRFTRRIDPGSEAQAARALVNALSIHGRGLQQPVGTLSGGNQQKVCLGKWLAAQCQILIVDEPTVGVDIGAKEQIHRLLDRLAEKEQRAILLISSDMPEIIRLADRILVFRAGRIAGEIDSVNDPSLSFEDISQAIGRLLN